MYEHLFTALELGKATLPNRICFLAHRTNFARRGRISKQHIAYYGRRAIGGCGLIVLGELCIHPLDRPWEKMILAYDPAIVEDYGKLSDAVHKSGTMLFAQLCHHGFQSNGAITRHPILGPSAVADIAFGETAKAMETEDMREIIRAFSQAAALVKSGGLDGVEIDMGPESLLRQFLSPISNHRQDEYGGTMENRLRFPIEVVDGVRRSVGGGLTVGIRLCSDERFWGGINDEESAQFAKRFESTGQIDFINVAVGTYYNLHLLHPSMFTSDGFTKETARQLKEAVNLPVIASHQIGFPQMADAIIEKGEADAVGLTRNLICDPDAPSKAHEGRSGEIRHCVRDNEMCIGRTSRSRTLSCIQNPGVGFESSVPSVGSPVETERKRIMIIGAGPAGLEAARVAALKGHEVAVYERDAEIGGQVNLAKQGAGRASLYEVIRYLDRALGRLEVPVFKNTPMDSQKVLEEAAEVVIIATGAQPIAKPVPGEYGPPDVQSVWDVIQGRFSVGDRVLFIDENGGHRSTATVELLADQGKKVDMITSDLFVGMELAPIGDLYLTRQRLLQKGVTFTCDVQIDVIERDIVKGRQIHSHEPVVYEGYDTVVIEMGTHANDHLYKALKGKIPKLIRVGDCVAPRNIGMAIFEGRRAGEAL